jgi:hypothetical protein
MKSIIQLFTILSLALRAASQPERMTAVFVNEHPRDDITLYWVNHDLEEDDPERLVSEPDCLKHACINTYISQHLYKYSEPKQP